MPLLVCILLLPVLLAVVVWPAPRKRPSYRLHSEAERTWSCAITLPAEPIWAERRDSWEGQPDVIDLREIERMDDLECWTRGQISRGRRIL